MKQLKTFILSLVLAVTAFTFVAPAAPAFAENCPIQDVTKEIPAQILASGGFDTSEIPGRKPIDFGCTKVIRSVVVDLEPENATGVIDEIKITRLENKNSVTEFGCKNIKIKDGDDLTLLCGGPAVLEAGLTEYYAKGSNFGTPSGGKVTKFQVTLGEDFSEQRNQVYGVAKDDTVKSVQSLYGL